MTDAAKKLYYSAGAGVGGNRGGKLRHAQFIQPVHDEVRVRRIQPGRVRSGYADAHHAGPARGFESRQ